MSKVSILDNTQIPGFPPTGHYSNDENEVDWKLHLMFCCKDRQVWWFVVRRKGNGIQRLFLHIGDELMFDIPSNNLENKTFRKIRSVHLHPLHPFGSHALGPPGRASGRGNQLTAGHPSRHLRIKDWSQCDWPWGAGWARHDRYDTQTAFQWKWRSRGETAQNGRGVSWQRKKFIVFWLRTMVFYQSTMRHQQTPLYAIHIDVG